MRGMAKVTFPQAYSISLPRDTAMNTHCFYTSAFSTLCFVSSAMDGKTEQCVCIKFCVKLGKSTIKTLEMLCEAFGEHSSLSWIAVFEWHPRFKADQVSVEDDEPSGQPSTSKTTENGEKIRSHP
jgi:hypothetical protein